MVKYMYVMSQIEFTEVLAEHDEKREIVLDNTLKTTNRILFWVQQKKKPTQVIKSFLECLISVLRSKSFRLV